MPQTMIEYYSGIFYIRHWLSSLIICHVKTMSIKEKKSFTAENQRSMTLFIEDEGTYGSSKISETTWGGGF